MSDTQDSGTATTDAGGTQNADTTGQAAAVAGTTNTTDGTTATSSQAQQPGDGTKAAEVDYAFAAPEGLELNQGDLDEFKTIAKELKLPKEQAQKVVDLAIKREQARAEAFTKQVSDWGEQVSKDPELGKPENLALAVKAIETFGTPELRSLLDSTGMGNHPEVVRLALKIGKAISEDTIVRGRNTPSGGAKDPASVLYGNTPT